MQKTSNDKQKTNWSVTLKQNNCTIEIISVLLLILFFMPIIIVLINKNFLYKGPEIPCLRIIKK